MRHNSFVAMAAVLMASAAGAAPPPPPPPDDIAVVRRFIAATVTKDATAYAEVLADDVTVTQDGRQLARGKVAWMKLSTSELQRPSREVKSEGVWIGFDFAAHTPRGELNQALVSERISQAFGDCCVYHRTETLTLKSGKIVSIELSRLFQMQLQNDGRRQEDQ